ncbi:hypothetical protein BC829DRAFT_414903 [Chytridium lagenaria]|nr:hypothetical protein BC829DRAFT_414903 [Chytridium lagenaria]
MGNHQQEHQRQSEGQPPTPSSVHSESHSNIHRHLQQPQHHQQHQHQHQQQQQHHHHQQHQQQASHNASSSTLYSPSPTVTNTPYHHNQQQPRIQQNTYASSSSSSSLPLQRDQYNHHLSLSTQGHSGWQDPRDWNSGSFNQHAPTPTMLSGAHGLLSVKPKDVVEREHDEQRQQRHSYQHPTTQHFTSDGASNEPPPPSHPTISMTQPYALHYPHRPPRSSDQGSPEPRPVLSSTNDSTTIHTHPSSKPNLNLNSPSSIHNIVAHLTHRHRELVAALSDLGVDPNLATELRADHPFADPNLPVQPSPKHHDNFNNKNNTPSSSYPPSAMFSRSHNTLHTRSESLETPSSLLNLSIDYTSTRKRQRETSSEPPSSLNLPTFHQQHNIHPYDPSTAGPSSLPLNYPSSTVDYPLHRPHIRPPDKPFSHITTRPWSISDSSIWPGDLTPHLEREDKSLVVDLLALWAVKPRRYEPFHRE